MTTPKVTTKTFDYQGISRTGKLRKGQIEALDAETALLELEGQRLNVTKLEPTKNLTLFQSKPTMNQEGLYLMEIAVLLGATTPLADALQSAHQGSTNPILKRAGIDIEYRYREKGEKLSEAMAAHPKIFDRPTIAMIRAGDRTGKVGGVLQELAELRFWTAEIMSNVRKAINKPMYVMAFALIVMYLLTTRVVPQFMGIITSLKGDAPFITKMVISASKGMTSPLFLLLVALIVIGLPIAYRAFIASPAGRRKRDEILLKIPLVKQLLKNFILARTAKTLAQMLEAGVPREEALVLAGEITGNILYEEIFTEAGRMTAAGEPMAEVFKDYPALIPDRYVKIIQNGEEKGTLTPMLRQLAKIYEKEVDEQVAKVTDAIEPLMTIIVGVMVAIIMMAVMLPMGSIIDSLSK